MRIETTLELKTLAMRRAHKLTVVDLAIAGPLQSDDLEAIAAQWPIVRTWMSGREDTTGSQSFPMAETPCTSAILDFDDGHLGTETIVRSLRLDVVATEGEFLATLRLVLRFSVHALGDDTATTWGGRIGKPVAVELEVGT